MKRFILTAVMLSGMASFAWAQEAVNVNAGKRLAEANCSQCHNIEPGGAFKMYPPSFQAIAVYMDPDIMRMKILFPQHVTIMPQFHNYLFQNNTDNIIEYIQSLEK